MDSQIFDREKVIGQFKYLYNDYKEYIEFNGYGGDLTCGYFSKLCDISNMIFRFEEEDDDEYLTKFGNIIDEVIKEKHIANNKINKYWLITIFDKINYRINTTLIG